METFLIKALQLIVALAFLVIIHEFGHFIFARIFGIKVEKFYMFFNPTVSLFKWKPGRHVGSLTKMKYFDDDARQEDAERQQLENSEKEYEEACADLKKAEKDGDSTDVAAARRRMEAAEARMMSDLEVRSRRDAAEFEASKKESKWRRFWGHTEYGIGWLPLGGYCKIGGMIDESMDTAQMKKDPEPWEFRTKPAYQRLLVMLGGVLFNFILAIIIYAGIALYWGEKYVPLDKATEGFDFVPAAIDAGFRNGDIPLYADGEKLDASKAGWQMDMIEAQSVSVLRNHRDTVTIDIPEDFLFRLNDDKGFLAYRVPVVVGKLVTGEAAEKASMKEGDRIIAVDTIPTPAFTELTPVLADNAGKEVNLKVVRGGDTLTLPATPNEFGKLGFQLEALDKVYPTVTVRYNALQAVPKGWELGTGMLTNYVGSMKHVFSKEGAKSIGGFGAIGGMFPDRWDWYSFWQITAFLSVALAFMNIIPIPGLDGGHVMFLLWEILTGRKPGEKVLIIAQYIGMAFLLLLLIYANGNDLLRAFR